MDLRILIFFILFMIKMDPLDAAEFRLEKSQHTGRTLASGELQSYTSRVSMKEFQDVLEPIMIERGVGTEGHETVKDYIISQLKDNGFSIEQDTFQDTVPNFGTLQFTNIVGHLNPNAPRVLSLACHYDSKIMMHPFIGATDSAVPCAMLIYIAQTLQEELASLKNKRVGLDLIFFDGEEAFNEWSSTDSIYGARHLAAKWEKHSIQVSGQKDLNLNKLDKMDMLVLLDLLGTPNPRFYSYYPPTYKWYKQLVSIERRLQSLGLLNLINSNRSKKLTYFREMSTFPVAEDDHLPFYYLQVNCLHIIPYPFPSVWHKPSDNKSALDMNTIENLVKIFQVFVLEYLYGE